MTIVNSEHLLQQAARLLENPQRGPVRQADMRRAMSASYYAIFHLVLAAAADRVVGKVHRGSARYGSVYRSIEHKDLKTICDIVTRQAAPTAYQPHVPIGGFSAEIRRFAENAMVLQTIRNTADYDPSARFHVLDASRAINIARSAQSDWQTAPTEQREALMWLLLFRPRP